MAAVPSADHISLGRRGETLARRFLEHHAWEILETNWRFSRAEIDIIAKQQKLLVFFEVKTRRNDVFGQPDEAVDERKQLLIADAAAAYMREICYEWAFRFDVIAILLNPQTGQYQLRHHEDAFFPPLG